MNAPIATYRSCSCYLMDSKEATKLFAKMEQMIALADTSWSIAECWSHMSQQDMIATVAKSPSGWIIFLHHIKMDLANPLSENQLEMRYVIQGIDPEAHGVIIVSDIFEHMRVGVIKTENILGCQMLGEMEDTSKKGTHKIVIRSMQTVPPFIFKEWQKNGLEGKTANDLLFEMLVFTEMHDQEVTEEERVIPKIQELIKWLFHSATNKKWPITITDSTIPAKVRAWKKGLDLVFLDNPGERVNQSEQSQGSLNIANVLAKALNKEEKEENKGWKRLPENVKRLYIKITFDANNDPEKLAESFLVLLSQGNAQNLKVYLHFLLTTENCNLFLQPAISAMIQYGFIVAQSVTALKGLTHIMTPLLNPKIHNQDSKTALRAALQLEEGRGLSFKEINLQIKASYHAPESFYDLLYTLKNFRKVVEKICGRKALLT